MTRDIFEDASNNVLSHSNEGQVLASVPWPEHPMFGADHAKWTAKLAERILQSVFEQRGLGEPSPGDMKVIQGAAMFHDLGRGLKPEQSWRTPEPGHQQLSAKLAERVLASDAGMNYPVRTHAHILKLINGHRLPALGHSTLSGGKGGAAGSSYPNDPFEVALWDAECLESSRFDPNTESGLLVTRERFNLTVSAWAKLPAHRQRWRAERWRRG